MALWLAIGRLWTAESDIPSIEDTEDLALGCETVDDYIARWRSIAEQSKIEEE